MNYIYKPKLQLGHFNLLIIAVLLLGACCQESFNLPNSTTAKWLLNAKPWHINSVTINGQDYTRAYEGMILQFDAQNYTTSNGHWLWPDTGSWRLKGTNGDMFSRLDKDVDVNITKITDTELDLNFELPDEAYGKPNGRTEGGVIKRIVFTFTTKK